MTTIEDDRGGMTRRAVLQIAAAAAGGATELVWDGPASDVRPAAAAAPDALTNFLALSSLLTGVANLDPTVGKTYLDSIQALAASRRALNDLFQRAGFASGSPPMTLDALTRTGVFGDAALRGVAETIITCWYTGTYTAGGGSQVATWISALAWTTSYTKAMGVCGGPTGYWGAKPSA